MQILPTAPVPAISTFTDGAAAHQVDLNTLTANLTNLYNYDLGGFRTNRPLAAVRCTTESFATGSDTQITWDTVDLNYDSMWNSASTGQLTVNTAGIYRLYLQVAQNGALGFDENAFICVNGTSRQNNAVGTMNAGSGITLNCQATVSLAAGSTIYGFIFQNTGASQSVRTIYGGGCRLYAVWISPQ